MVVREDLKKRAVYLYLPTVEMADEWKELADKAGYPSRTKLIKQLREKTEEAEDLQKEKRLQSHWIDRLDAELAKYRAQPFLEQEYKGTRSYEKELVELLRKKLVVDSDHLLEYLGVNPQETEIVKAIDAQLRNLEAY